MAGHWSDDLQLCTYIHSVGARMFSIQRPSIWDREARRRFFCCFKYNEEAGVQAKACPMMVVEALRLRSHSAVCSKHPDNSFPSPSQNIFTPITESSGLDCGY